VKAAKGFSGGGPRGEPTLRRSYNRHGMRSRMRLLNVDNYELYTLYDEQRPQYAILSHTWAKGEITFTDIPNPNSPSTKNKAGYDKIVKTCKTG
jgi:hypothetical protein